MSLAELMPLVEKLPRADKQRLLDHLSQWSFHENGETAQKLLNYLNEEKAAGRA